MLRVACRLRSLELIGRLARLFRHPICPAYRINRLWKGGSELGFTLVAYNQERDSCFRFLARENTFLLISSMSEHISRLAGLYDHFPGSPTFVKSYVIRPVGRLRAVCNNSDIDFSTYMAQVWYSVPPSGKTGDNSRATA